MVQALVFNIAKEKIENIYHKQMYKASDKSICGAMQHWINKKFTP